MSLPEVIKLKNVKREEIPKFKTNKNSNPNAEKESLNADVSGKPLVEVYTALNSCEIARLRDRYDFAYSPSIALNKKEIAQI